MKQPDVPINTVPLQHFITQIKTAESSNQREVKLDMQAARRLAYTLTEILARLNGNLEEILSSNKSNTAGNTDFISVEIDGGKNW